MTLRHPLRRNLHAVAALALLLSLDEGRASCESGGEALSAAPAFRVYTVEDGVHLLTWEELAAAGLPEGVVSERIGMTHLGKPIPLFLRDGGDGLFGPGDALEFVAGILPGRVAHRHEYSPWNVFRLDLSGASAKRMVDEAAAPAGDGPSLALRRHRHLEEDRLLIRIESRGEHPDPAEVELPEPWFWHKMTQADRWPADVEIDLSDLALDSEAAVTLRIHLRGLSQPAQRLPGQPDHRVRIFLDGERIGVAAWNGKTTHLWESPPLRPANLGAGLHKLQVKVPKRQGAGERDLIDVVLLDWVEIEYPFDGRVGSRPVRVRAEPPGGTGPIEVLSGSASSLVAYDSSDRRVAASRSGAPAGAARWRFTGGGGDWHLVPDDALESPVGIEVDRPSELSSIERQADYLMIAHGSLIDAIRPLAEFHRRRDLSVAMVDVQDVYDEFNHGIIDPRAIRRFVQHAYREWQRPAPRFVLLVGDASWDTKNATVDDANYANWSNRQLAGRGRFPAKKVSTYDDRALNDRNLVPTWSSLTYQGHAASDNFFVAVEGDDYIPELAIGRFAVRTPEEVAGIVAKTIRYAEAPVGPWRRNTLWITNEQAWAQRLTDRVAARRADLGFETLKVYPQSEEADNARHQERLLEALDGGLALVHFLGHGGRFIWRTGPPDYEKNHDLFGLEQLDLLQPNDRLPVILSMSCFTSPFDHPNADSIGEKFVRLPDRGAVAVLGASWRNMPQQGFSDALVRELERPGTIGEAVLAAKRSYPDRIMIETYNLLGDPAAPISVPAALPLSSPEPGRVAATLSEALVGGEVVVDWLGEGGEVVSSDRMPASDRLVEARFESGAESWESLRAVRVYAWNEAAGADSIGRLELLPDSTH
jgi:hypothetical protein